MKKLLLFVTMAASLLFTQCKKEESVSSAGKTVSMTVTAGPGSKTDITDAGTITWSTGDKLYVGDGTQYIGYLTLVGEGGSATGVFTGNVTLPTDTKDGEKSFGFFYLGSGELTLEDDATSVDVDFSSQDITKGEDGKLTNASKQHVGYGSAKGTVINDVVTDINVMLVSKVALAHFDIKKEGVAYSAQLTLSGDNIYNEMTVNFDGTFAGKDGSTDGGISLNNGSSGNYYVMLVPTEETTGSQELTFTGDNVAGPATLNDGIKPNQFYGKDEAIPVTLESTKVPVEKVELNKDELSLEVGGTETLTATVTPDNATDKSVMWSVSTTGVVTVENGLVTAVAAGEATITVTATNGTDATDDDKTATCTVTVTAPKPVFSVGENTTVEFAPGNLYYDGEKFHFEPNQWSFKNSWDAKHVSHFLWSKDKDVAVGTSTSVSGGADDVFFTNATETTANSTFQVDGEEPGTWRILSKDEWGYLMTRTVNGGTGEGKSYQMATVNDVYGMILYPDNYTGQTTATNYTSAEWTSMEKDGVVFLPAAGYRDGTKVEYFGSYGFYWSSTPTPNSTDSAINLFFYSGSVSTQQGNLRHFGDSVRLVR